MADKEFIKLLDSNGFERLRFMIRTEKGEVMDVTVQYESYINDEWHNIVRYDCAHGFFHRDILSPEGEKEKQVIAIENLNDALLYAEQDFKDRWQLYKKRFMNKMKKEEVINRNITLSFDFLREIVKSPSKLNEIPNNSTIEFIEKDRPFPGTEKKKSPDKYFKVKHHFEKI